jgi:hypothetical protein
MSIRVHLPGSGAIFQSTCMSLIPRGIFWPSFQRLAGENSFTELMCFGQAHLANLFMLKSTLTGEWLKWWSVCQQVWVTQYLQKSKSTVPDHRSEIQCFHSL